jgi:MFS family permease
MKFNLYLVKSSLVGALGGLLFGFDTAVIAGTTHALTINFNLTSAQLGLTVSIALWGTVLGAMLSGLLGENLVGEAHCESWQLSTLFPLSALRLPGTGLHCLSFVSSVESA